MYTVRITRDSCTALRYYARLRGYSGYGFQKAFMRDLANTTFTPNLPSTIWQPPYEPVESWDLNLSPETIAKFTELATTYNIGRPATAVSDVLEYIAMGYLMPKPWQYRK